MAVPRMESTHLTGRRAEHLMACQGRQSARHRHFIGWGTIPVPITVKLGPARIPFGMDQDGKVEGSNGRLAQRPCSNKGQTKGFAK